MYQSWEYINRSQTHECGNWDWGRAIPRKEIHKWDFPCSVQQTMLPLDLSIVYSNLCYPCKCMFCCSRLHRMQQPLLCCPWTCLVYVQQPLLHLDVYTDTVLHVCICATLRRACVQEIVLVVCCAFLCAFMLQLDVRARACVASVSVCLQELCASSAGYVYLQDPVLHLDCFGCLNTAWKHWYKPKKSYLVLWNKL
jgi:hypothetical protein